jgi:hypothetical protein
MSKMSADGTFPFPAPAQFIASAWVVQTALLGELAQMYANAHEIA